MNTHSEAGKRSRMANQLGMVVAQELHVIDEIGHLKFVEQS
jgi:hypothetical protein